MVATRVYEEVIDFLASGASPEEIIAYTPSDGAKARVWELIQRKKASELSPEGDEELAVYAQLEHIMRLAKARARIRVTPK
jgi:hypothetical protein